MQQAATRHSVSIFPSLNSLIPFHPFSNIPPGTIPVDHATRCSRSLTSPLARLNELIRARNIDPDGVRYLRIAVGADRGKCLGDVETGSIVASQVILDFKVRSWINCGDKGESVGDGPDEDLEVKMGGCG